jgi:beta-N-acetylhexosaminidase
MAGLLREELDFRGVTISDALDMRALAQGAAQAVEIIAVVRAGVDLLLCSADRRAQRRIEATLAAAASRGLFDEPELRPSAARVAALRAWLAAAGPAPDLSVVGCAEHRALSRELAERSVALVRGWRGAGGSGGAGLVPPSLPARATILAIMPQPTDLTPADTSRRWRRTVALQTRFTSVEEVVVGIAPTDTEIAALRDDRQLRCRRRRDDRRDPAAGPIRAGRIIAATGGPRSRALRTPWDVASYPDGVAAVCTYSILPDSLEALAAALAGAIPFVGRLPVAVPGVPAVHGAFAEPGAPLSRPLVSA